MLRRACKLAVRFPGVVPRTGTDKVRTCITSNRWIGANPNLKIVKRLPELLNKTSRYLKIIFIQSQRRPAD